jgi:hypothetical protein
MNCHPLEFRSGSTPDAAQRSLGWPVFGKRMSFPDPDSEISGKSAGLNLSKAGAFAAPKLVVCMEIHRSNVSITFTRSSILGSSASRRVWDLVERAWTMGHSQRIARFQGRPSKFSDFASPGARNGFGTLVLRRAQAQPR